MAHLTTPAQIASSAVKTGASRAVIRAAIEAQVMQLRRELAKSLDVDLSDKMTDDSYYSSGRKAKADAAIRNLESEIALLEAALREVSDG